MIKSVKIGYREYEIRWMDSKDGEARRAFGECSTNTATIFVDADLPPIKRAHTLVHEVMHGIWCEMCLRDGDDEERIVSAFSNSMTQIFTDNPELIAHLTSEYALSNPEAAS